MIRQISADYIYPVSSKPIKNGLLTYDDQSGEIISLEVPNTETSKTVEHYSGMPT